MRDWIVPALLALNTLLLLAWWLKGGGKDREKREEDARRAERTQLEAVLRSELQDTSRATRQELAAALALQQQTLLTQSGDVARTQNEQVDSFRAQLGAMQQAIAQTLQGATTNLAEQLRGLSESNERRLAEVRQVVEGRLHALQEGNEKKLEQMRATVDEKLHASLEQPPGESFRQEADRLEQVLAREQYAANVETVPGSGARVEFAIRLPGRREDGLPLWLPIDAKFPREDYERLLDAQERADAAGVETAAKAIEARLKLEAKTMRGARAHGGGGAARDAPRLDDRLRQGPAGRPRRDRAARPARRRAAARTDRLRSVGRRAAATGAAVIRWCSGSKRPG